MGTIEIDGATPKLTIGNATAEDALILFDGAAQDFYIGLDDSADDLIIGLGSAVGTTPAISINEDRDVTISDGAIDFDIASHDTSNGLKLGGTLVTATAAELNIMDGVTATAAEINLIDGGTARGTTSLADGDGILINDAGTMRMTNVTTVKTYMSTSLDGIDDQTSSNDDQLTITDTAVVINEDGDDVDFRIEGDDNDAVFSVDGGLNSGVGLVGIGSSPDLGVGLHIKTADSGASVDANGDELVIENSGNTGLTILSGTSSTGGIYFGDSGSNNIGYVEYIHNGNSLDFGITSTRMRITSGGDVGIGATAASPNPNFYFQSGSNAQLHIGHDSNCASGQAYQAFFYDGSAIGTITQNGTTAVAYNTSSDYRLKENETAITDGITRIKQLKPYRFNFKTDADTTLDGFFAHEVSSIVPEAISGEKDAMIPEVLYTDEILYTDEDTLPEGKNIGDVKHSIGDVKEATKINPQGIDQSKLVPLLTSALQEAITKIETLEAKVAVLEG